MWRVGTRDSEMSFSFQLMYNTFNTFTSTFAQAEQDGQEQKLLFLMCQAHLLAAWQLSRDSAILSCFSLTDEESSTQAFRYYVVIISSDRKPEPLL